MRQHRRLFLLVLLLALSPFLFDGMRFVFRAIRSSYAETRLPASSRDLADQLAELEPLHGKLPKPKDGDWLFENNEPGQTFAEYVACDPVRPTDERHTIYVQPLGTLNDKERQIIDLSAEFIALYFNCPVKTLKPMDDDVMPEKARRVNPHSRRKQFLTTYVLDEVLKPSLPDDALAFIAFTATDLWPGDGWNFVFGQASTRSRVGVWSMARFGEPDASDEEFRVCLSRTLGTATHETGHMLSIQHCTAFLCNMCGSNSLAEGDRYPLYLCPQCVTKVCWATKASPVKRFEKLAAFCKKHGLADEETYYRKAIDLLSKPRVN